VSRRPPGSDVGAPTASLRLDEVLAETFDHRVKGAPADPGAWPLSAVAASGWGALDGSLTFPLLVLKESALDRNIAVMADYCQRHGVSLAPHAKTPVAPQILARQIAAGAWGVTVANFHQARLFRQLGASRILLANQLLSRAELAWVARELAADPGFAFCALVDSLDGAELMEAHLAASGASTRLDVLIELGLPGGRCGCRTVEEGTKLADWVAALPHLRLAGVETYENVLDTEDLQGTIARIDALLADLSRLAGELDARGRFADVGEIIVSAGGSMFFDRVTAALAGQWELSRPVRVVLRSGAYVTHDAGGYDRRSALAGRAGPAETARLEQALELWATVQSIPEPGLAILAFGKRDAAYDRGPPVPFAAVRDGALRPLTPDELTVFALNDHHARARLAADSPLRVGDLAGLHVCHPCTSFDKFRFVPLVDDDYRVREMIRCYL
jgi:D-serine dehydratase